MPRAATARPRACAPVSSTAGARCEGPNFLAIDPDECIDCAVCIPECPVNAIVPEEDVPQDQLQYIQLNAELARGWPSITKRKAALADADAWADKKNKLSELNR